MCYNTGVVTVIRSDTFVIIVGLTASKIFDKHSHYFAIYHHKFAKPMLFTINFNFLDPVAVQLGSINIHWYGILYALAIYLCSKLISYLDRGQHFDHNELDTLTVYLILGIVIGSRLGYVLFYQTQWLWLNPKQIFKTWEGGMSFHGGVLGAFIALYLFCSKYEIRLGHACDLLSAVTPIGLFLGRIGNFINGELYGRTTSVPWAMIFPNASDGLPRHPSQLYEAICEGILLQIIMWWCYKKFNKKEGLCTSVFLISYGIARILMEMLREPDGMFGPLTKGQVLTLPCLAIGVVVALMATRNKSGIDNN